MALYRITRTQRDVITTLHHARTAALAKQALDRDGDIEVRVSLAGMQRGEQAGAAAAENQDIGLQRLVFHSESPQKKSEGNKEGTRNRDRGIVFLRIAPRQIFQREQA